ncbi:hypothetical protein [Streptomyces chartreusis]|uniref:hypothetical protein n=1 Tax=Streptomyces chartreusis TaxID=1969 RepID=UPI002E19E7CB
MPNRRAVIGSLTQDVLGAQVFNGLIGECKSMPDARYRQVQDAMAAVLERFARAIDWPRLLREASSRHIRLHPDKKLDPRDWSAAENVCGECLEEALLADDIGAPDWERHPTAPREHANTDWPTAVHANLRYRKRAHWHPYMEPSADTTGHTPDTAAADTSGHA